MRIATLTGDAIVPHLAEIGALRIAVFREWPYLYDGYADYESRYLARYSVPRAAVIAAFDGDRVVGAATCLPLDDAGDSVRRGFAAAGLDSAGYFLFRRKRAAAGVSRARHRRGVLQGAGGGGRRLRHRHVLRGTARRRRSAPAGRPTGPLHEFWHHRGYAEQPELFCEMTWQDVGDAAPTPHRLNFWSKALPR